MIYRFLGIFGHSCFGSGVARTWSGIPTWDAVVPSSDCVIGSTPGNEDNKKATHTWRWWEWRERQGQKEREKETILKAQNLFAPK